MPNIAAVLKSEIVRLARRELRREVSNLQKASSLYRRDIAALKRQVKKHQRSIELLEKKILAKPVKVEVTADTSKVRYSAKNPATHRAKLGLSARDYAKLVGASALSIYKWEKGKARPRRELITALAELRKIGKREALARLKQISRKK